MARKKRRASRRPRPRRPEARLVRFEQRRRGATCTLGGKEVRIGRDPTCDLIVDFANVSRQHAIVRELGDRNVVLDLGSTNGVRVNGTPIGGKPRLLEPGDVIELSEEVALLYEEGPFSSSTPWVVTAVAMLILLAAAMGLYLSVRSDAPEAPLEDAPGATPRTSSIWPGPQSIVPGTHPGMLPTRVPQRSGSKADSRTSSRRWYARIRTRSSGDPWAEEAVVHRV